MPALFTRRKRVPPASREAAIALFGETAFSYGDDDTLSPEESSALDSDAWMSAYAPSSGAYPTSSKLVAHTARDVIESYNPADAYAVPRPQRPSNPDGRFPSLKRLSSTFTMQHGNVSLGDLITTAVSIDDHHRGKPSTPTISRRASDDILSSTTSALLAEKPSSYSTPSSSSSSPVQPSTAARARMSTRSSTTRESLTLNDASLRHRLTSEDHFNAVFLPHYFTTPSQRSYKRDPNGVARKPLPQPKPRYVAPELRPRASLVSFSASGSADAPSSSGSSQSSSPHSLRQRNRQFVNYSMPSVDEPDRSTKDSTSSEATASSRSSAASSSSYVNTTGTIASGGPTLSVAKRSSSDTMSVAEPSESSMSLASSMIFERQVQDPALSSDGIPSHHQNANLIPPVLTASCEVLVDDNTNPEQVEVVSFTRPASIKRSNSNTSLASLASTALSLQDRSSTAYATLTNNSGSCYSAATSTSVSGATQQRLSFYSYADVLNGSLPVSENIVETEENTSQEQEPSLSSSKNDDPSSNSSSNSNPGSMVTITTLGEALRRNQNEILSTS
ncbi:uncharacterized protein V2V93DRAFT_376997 [Kockiozyma suomiensis]|uniref:uncharacterized protein n=1 Tax=Kockiozyma suomiensis TaxID=1337062 RepID=UPI00334360C6